MTDQKKTRRAKLEEFLEKNPNDAFSRYGIALDCLNDEDYATADKHFRVLLQSHPDYVPAYLMYAQMLVKQERNLEAKSALAAGIEAAAHQGNQHARSEMEGLLSQIS